MCCDKETCKEVVDLKDQTVYIERVIS